MREVSCKAMWIGVEILRRLDVPLERILEGLPLTPAQLRDPGNRISWDLMCELDERVEKACGGPEELERLSALFAQAPPMVGLRSLAGLIASPRMLYYSGHRWFGPSMFTITESTFEDLPGGRIKFTLRIPERYRDSPQFFRINAGVFRANPRIIGLSDAVIAWELSARQAIYLIDPPPSLTIWARFKRMFRMIVATRTAFDELGAQQAQLKARFEQLELAHAQIAVQSGQLQTVSLLGRELTRHTDLKLLAAAIIQLLTERFRASGVVVRLRDAEAGRDRVIGESGERTGGPGRTLTLASAGQPVGSIDLWGFQAPDAEASALLDSLIPWVSIALENAHSFGLLRDYQADLELKVAERTEQLEQSLRALTEADRQKSDFFANASHELRTPLTLMLSPLESLARSAELPAEAREEAESALRNGYRLLKLVNDVLDLARVEAGRMRLQTGPTDLARILTECTRQWRPALAARRLSLEVAVPASLPLVADAERLEQVILNLVSNAVKNTPDGRGIRVEAGEKDGGLEFTVTNEGEAIDPADLARLFERFAQALNSRARRYGSSGLGLPVVRELVELHGGQVSVANVAGGVEFKVRLPLGPPPEEARPIEVPRPGRSELRQYQISSEVEVAPAPAPAQLSDKPLLLIAEDNSELRAFLVRCLREDFQILESADGAQALALARERLPDLILSDVMMPGTDGLELCHAVKSSPATCSTPFVMLTARADIDARLAGFNCGADDYLVKPFHIEEVRARLASQLRLRRLAEQVSQSEKLAALGTLVAGVAHEVRNPLNSIINSLAPLKEALAGSAPEIVELIDMALESSKRVDYISGRLLEQARSDQGHRSRVDLSQSLALALQMLAHKVEGGPALEARIPPGVDLSVDGEAGSLSQVWINLVDNAIQAAGRKGRVEVSASRSGGRILIEVADDGPGIEPRHLKRIFDPFFTTKDIGKGTGLGLSLVRDIVHRHGGGVVVDSSPGAGARFKVSLPASDNPASELFLRAGAARA